MPFVPIAVSQSSGHYSIVHTRLQTDCIMLCKLKTGNLWVGERTVLIDDFQGMIITFLLGAGLSLK